MTTYSVREFKAKVSEILHALEDGEEVIITRRGKACARLTHVQSDEKRPVTSLRGIFRDRLPDLTWEDFVEAKKIWEPRIPDDL